MTPGFTGVVRPGFIPGLQLSDRIIRGSFGTDEDHPYTKDPQQTTKKVQFSRPYAATPKVVVWLTGYDIKNGTTIRINTAADNITSNGFDLHIDTWSDIRLYYASASWIAYPADKREWLAATTLFWTLVAGPQRI